MTNFAVGDLVVLKSGSMRMCVETAGEDTVACVWAHEGAIGRDSFSPALLERWVARDEMPRPAPRSFDAEPPRPEAEAPRPYRPAPRPMVDDHAKPYRPAGDGPKPYRPTGDGPKPYRPAGDGPKPYRPAGDKPFRAGGDKPFRAGGDKPYRDGPPKPYRPAAAPDGPPRKTGWDGKPRDKKFFRKDD